MLNIGRSAVFQNADTRRTGTEASLSYAVFQGLDVSFAYTYADFTFERFVPTPAIEGNRLPGQPEHQFYAEVAYTHPSGLYAVSDMLHVDEVYADNRNTAEYGACHVANLRFSRDFTFGPWGVSPFFGSNNVFNEVYNQNVIFNAAANRYFEPAPDRYAYRGLTARYRFQG